MTDHNAHNHDLHYTSSSAYADWLMREESRKPRLHITDSSSTFGLGYVLDELSKLPLTHDKKESSVRESGSEQQGESDARDSKVDDRVSEGS